MDKTPPVNILLGNSKLCNTLVMLSCINFSPSVFSVTATISKLSSQDFGTVPLSGLDTVLPLSADGYSSWSQGQPGQCGLNPAVQSHNSGDGSAAEVS